MLSKQLLEGVRYYNERYPHWVDGYKRLRAKGDEFWLHLEKLDEDQIRQEVIRGFLNKWLCRVSYESTTSLHRAIGTLSRLYSAIEDETIDSIEFDAHVSIDGKRLSKARIAEMIMQRLLEVEPKFGPVPASKLMHMAIPRLFMMWDTEIRRAYGIPVYYFSDHADWYVKFLKLMRCQINHAIDDFQEVNGVDRQTAISQIRSRDGNTTLTRMLDKYNFALRDGRVKVCNQCLGSWKRNLTLPDPGRLSIGK